MMSSIKDKRRKNDNNELSKHSQNAEIVIRQESNVTFKKVIQSEMKRDNEKIFSHKFSKNDAVDYIIFVKKNEHELKI